MFLPLLGLIVLAFFVFSGNLLAQTWKEPATKNPTLNPLAPNVPSLIRVENKRCLAVNGTGTLKVCNNDGDCSATPGETCKNLQSVQGKLRVGSSATSDISSTFEVLGDFRTNESMLIDYAFDSTGASASCATIECTAGSKTPAFLVQKAALSSGIGTNNLNARLAVVSAVNENQSTLYGGSTASNGIYGLSTSTPFVAGVYGVASTQNSIGVFGKAVDMLHRGIYGQTNASYAALFRGNIQVIGGFMQGDGANLKRVGSVNDLGLSQAGQVGESAWARTGVTINPSGNTDVAIGVTESYIVKQLTVLLKPTIGGSYQPISAYSNITVSIVGTNIHFVNTSLPPTEYIAKIFMQLQTGVAVTVSSYVSGSPKQIINSKSVLFDTTPNNFYELGAKVDGSTNQSFTWNIESGDGQLCDKDKLNCGSSQFTSTALDHVFYKMAAAYDSDPSHMPQIKVVWSNGPGTIIRYFTLNLINIVQPDFQAAACEVNIAKDIPVTVGAPFTSPQLLFSLQTGSTGNVVTKAGNVLGYTVPSLLPAKQYIVAQLTQDPDVHKVLTLYAVPTMDPKAKFPTPGPQQGLETNTLAKSSGANNYPVDLFANLQVDANPTTVSCIGGCTTWAGTTGTFKSINPGATTLTFTWDPLDADYCAGCLYSKTLTLNVGDVSLSGYGNATRTYVTITMNGYPTNLAEQTVSSTIGNSDTFNQPVGPAPLFSNVLGSTRFTPSNSINSIGIYNGYIRGIFTAPSQAASYTVTVTGRTTYDLRQVISKEITVPTTACDCIVASGMPPACCTSTPQQSQPQNPNL